MNTFPFTLKSSMRKSKQGTWEFSASKEIKSAIPTDRWTPVGPLESLHQETEEFRLVLRGKKSKLHPTAISNLTLSPLCHPPLFKQLARVIFSVLKPSIPLIQILAIVSVTWISDRLSLLSFIWNFISNP